jgi:hypothetical protein
MGENVITSTSRNIYIYSMEFKLCWRTLRKQVKYIYVVEILTRRKFNTCPGLTKEIF